MIHSFYEMPALPQWASVFNYIWITLFAIASFKSLNCLFLYSFHVSYDWVSPDIIFVEFALCPSIISHNMHMNHLYTPNEFNISDNPCNKISHFSFCLWIPACNFMCVNGNNLIIIFIALAFFLVWTCFVCSRYISFSHVSYSLNGECKVVSTPVLAI